MTAGAREPTEEEMRAALEEQLRRITVEDVLLQTVVTLINLVGARSAWPEDEEKDLEQAKLGIEGARALLPLLPEQDLAPFARRCRRLQMAYAQEAGAGAGSQDAGRGSQVAGDEGSAEPKTGAPPSPSERLSGPRRARRSGRRRGREPGAAHRLACSGAPASIDFSTTWRRSRWRPRTGRRRRTCASGRSRARAWRSCLATATTTSCRRTGSTTARTSGRCARSA